MMNHQQSQTSMDGEIGLSIFFWICRSFAFSMEVFLRKGFGLRYTETHVMGSIVLIPFYCMLCECRRCEAMWLFYFGFFMMLLYHRIMRFKRYAGNQNGYVHSYYSGKPRIMRKGYKGTEELIKRWDEPMLVTVLGVCLLVFSEEPFSWFMTIAGICMFIKNAVQSQMQKNELANIRDAMLNQQMLAQRLRHWR